MKLERTEPLSNPIRPILYSIFGGAILAFGLYEVHAVSDITEGGILGLTLLFQHHWNWSPAVSGFVLNAICYCWGYALLGKRFIRYSILSALSFSGLYAILENTPPLFPGLIDLPLLAAIVGACFVGIGVGLAVRAGGAPSGDDAFALSVQKLTGVKLSTVYLITDLIVLALSLTYLPPEKLLFSLLTVVLSGQIIGILQQPISLPRLIRPLWKS